MGPTRQQFDIETVVTLGLGDNSFLVGSGDEAVLIDPQRDAWRFTAIARDRGWRIRYVLETHVHNDYVSGALEARSVTGADVVVHARSGPHEFPHRAIEPGDDVRIGDVRLVARAAPGHTFEHLAWAAFTAGRATPEAVFTGGSLLVGSAGRSDLLGEEHAEELARLQYRTVRDLATLPADTRVMPTHGAGSFCVSTAPSADRTSTIAAELATNAALLAADEEAFVREQLGSLGRFPAYYSRMAAINRAGPPIIGALPALPLVGPGEAAALASGGAWVIDARERSEFAGAHIPGSVNVELDDAFGTYVGWIVPFSAPLVLVLPAPVDASARMAMTQLMRIGWDAPVSHLAGGLDAWLAGGRPTRSYPVAAMRDLFERRVRGGDALPVLDVRQPAEWRDDGTIPDSLRIFVADLPAHVEALPRHEELWVVCTTGHRAAVAASLLDRAGIKVRLVSRGGTVGWIERFAEPVATGVRPE